MNIKEALQLGVGSSFVLVFGNQMEDLGHARQLPATLFLQIRSDHVAQEGLELLLGQLVSIFLSLPPKDEKSINFGRQYDVLWS